VVIITLSVVNNEKEMITLLQFFYLSQDVGSSLVVCSVSLV
jgi:hypothetical protein